MSILRVDEIRDNGAGFNDVVKFANSGGTENGQLARAWVNFNGSGAVAIRANFNVNSITDHSSGNYGVNFANSLSDANYVISVMGTDDNTASTYFYIQGVKGGSFEPTAGTVRVYSLAEGIGPSDRTIMNVIAFR